MIDHAEKAEQLLAKLQAALLMLACPRDTGTYRNTSDPKVRDGNSDQLDRHRDQLQRRRGRHHVPDQSGSTVHKCGVHLNHPSALRSSTAPGARNRRLPETPGQTTTPSGIIVRPNCKVPLMKATTRNQVYRRHSAYVPFAIAFMHVAPRAADPQHVEHPIQKQSIVQGGTGVPPPLGGQQLSDNLPLRVRQIPTHSPVSAKTSFESHLCQRWESRFVDRT